MNAAIRRINELIGEADVKIKGLEKECPVELAKIETYLSRNHARGFMDSDISCMQLRR